MFKQFLAEVLTSAVISTALVACLAFITRSWLSERIKNSIRHEYDQKLESHKAQLKSQGEVEVERLRSQLAIQASERSVVFTRLHEQRATVIAETYSKLRSMHVALGDYTKVFEPAGDKPREERRASAAEAHKNFIDYYPANRIFLPKSCLEKIDKINQTAIEIFNGFLFEIDLVGPQRSDTMRWLSLFERVKTEMSDILVELEGEFRKILGDES